MTSLLSYDDINKIYGNKYRVYNLYKHYKKNKNGINEYLNLLNYIKSNFNIIININKKHFSDAYFYITLRNNLKINNEQIIEQSKKLYREKHIKKKVDDILKYTHNINTIKKTLDIGTEDEYFLDVLNEKTGYETLGINIKTGYEHYFNSSSSDSDNDKIIYYDGLNFPFEKNTFDLVTMIAVLHHVDNIGKFIKNLCKITKYIYIKDNDMVTRSSYDLIEIQHELYEGILYPNNRSPLFKLTKDYVINKFNKYGFVVVKQTDYEIFTRPFTLLLKKLKN
jgi:2-polyprenyl-3-methyl-5-hydroxy-6-metoxy-1,4-benzoquinol methylase